MGTIGRTIVIHGEVSSGEDLVIEGHVHGQIQVPTATLTIGPQGYVENEVRAARVRIHGAAKGIVAASERIELGPAASVTGTLSANQVVMADGARFKGCIDMGRRTIAAKVAQYKAEQARAR